MFRDYGHPFRIPILLFICGAVVLFTFGAGEANRTAFLVTVDMQVGQNSVAELFWNDFQDPSVRQAVTGGVRQKLEFRVPPTPLWQLRFDPTELAAENVVIYGISILRIGDGSVVNLSPQVISGWIAVNVADAKLNPDSLAFRSITNDPILAGPVDIAVPWWDAFTARMRTYVHSDTCVAQIIVFGAILAALASIAWKSLLPIVLAYVAPLFFLFHAGAIFSFARISTSYDVSSSVGHAALRGISADPPRWGSLIAGLLSVLLGIASTYWIRTLHLRNHDVGFERRISRPAAFAAVLCWLVVLFILLSPDLRALAQQAATQTFFPLWDYNNVNAWAGFIARGERPFVDFWYPYGGLWAFFLPLPYGTIVRWAYMTLLYWVAGVAIWRLVRHRFGLLGFAFSALVVLLAEASILNQPERYLLSTAIAVAYAAIDRDKPLGNSGRIWFWLACTVALWGETLQVAYAGPAVLVAWISSEVPIRVGALTSVLRRAVLDFAAPTASALGLILFYVWRGELEGVIETYLQASGHWTYAVIPTDLQSQFALANIVSAALAGTYFLIFLGTLRVLDPAQAQDAKLARAILSCGLIALILFQKHWLRPIWGQLLEPVIIGALLVIPLYWDKARSRAVIALSAGALVVSLAINNSIPRVAWDRVTGSYSRLTSTLRTLIGDRPLIDKANSEAFAAPRFVHFKEELAVVERMKALGKHSLFVDGDMPIFYLFSDPPPPFQVNQFNTSPIRAQFGVTKWLDERKPEVAILDVNSLTLDDIQYVVRIPVVAIKAMLDYVPREKIGRYYLLDRRPDSQPVALDFWKEVYGPVINYGHILRYGRVGGLPACVPPAAGCDRYLKISFMSAGGPEPIKLPVEVGSSAFEIDFVRVPGVQDYYVSPDRVWFWVLGEAMGLTPRVSPPSGAAYVVEQVNKASRRPILY